MAFCQPTDVLETTVDRIVVEAIEEEAFPGCVIYAADQEGIIFFKGYGFHTYDSVRRVELNDIYDLASVTKVSGATLALMRLYEDKLIQLDDPLDTHLPRLGKIGKVTIRECLAHQAGLKPWIPYYQKIKKKNGNYKRKTVGFPKKEYTYPLSDSLFLHKDFYNKIRKMIRKTKLDKQKKYRYSGLFFYLIPEMVENVTGLSYSHYLSKKFFEPLRTETLVFNPLEKFDSAQIVPTEDDNYFRMQQIHGTVHDEGAIMMKGVSGNAGLFSNAKDLAKLWFMLLSGGKQDTVKYLSPETIQLFTTSQYPNLDNRRGLGFDKPLLKYDAIKSSVAEDASLRSYGHSGFTGPLVWADPEYDLLFIFLTNRVYPSRENRNIYNLNVRPRVHQAIYDYLKQK